MPILTSFQRKKLPSWARWGDEAAFAIFVALIAGGFLSNGYAGYGLTRGLAWCGCGLLGSWGLIASASGRFYQILGGTGKWILGLLAAWCLWGGLQCFPFPARLVEGLSPAVGEARKAMSSADVEPAKKATFALAKEKAILAWHELLACTLLFFTLCFLASRASLSERIATVIALSSILEGWIGILNFGFREGSRAYGAAINPNHHAALALMGLPVALILILRFREKRRGGGKNAIAGSDPSIIFIGIATVSVIGAVLSFSRGGIVLQGLVILVWLGIEGLGGRGESRRNPSVVKPREVALVGGCFVLMAFFAAATEGVLARFATPESLGLDRLQLAEATLGGFFETNLWGLGMHGAEATINQRLTIPTTTNAIYSHNDFVQAIAELGWPGLAAACVFGVMFLREHWVRSKVIQQKFSWSERRLQRAAWAGVIATLLHATVDFHLRIPLIGFLFLALLALATQNGVLHSSSAGQTRR